MVKNLPEMQETCIHSLGWEDPLEKERQPTPVLLPGKFCGWRILAGYSPRGHKESDTTKQLHFLTRNDLKLLIEIIANSFFNVEEVGVIKQ